MTLANSILAGQTVSSRPGSLPAVTPVVGCTSACNAVEATSTISGLTIAGSFF
jgi:hypothetical protein